MKIHPVFKLITMKPTRRLIFVCLILFTSVATASYAHVCADNQIPDKHEKYLSGPGEDEKVCIADFSFYPHGKEIKPDFFQFVNLSVGKIAFCIWDFGDGTISDEYSPGHEFPGAGTYNVCLIIFCEDSTGYIFDSDTICKPLIVNFNIGGHVFVDNYPIDEGDAWLYKIEDQIIPIDTTHFDTLGYYFFYQIEEGDYIIKTAPTSGSNFSSDYFPCYYGNEILWPYAEIVNVTGNNWELDVHLEPMSNSSYGTGIAEGTIMQLKTGEPLEGIEILLYDIESNAMKCTFSDQNGLFGLHNIEFGTYYISAEITGIYCDIQMITLDENNNYITGLEFYVDLSSPVDLKEPLYSHDQLYDVTISPNPARDKIDLQFKVQSSKFKMQGCRLQVYDVSGKIVKETDVSEANSSINIDVSHYQNGIYSVILRDSKNIYAKEKFIVVQ